MSILHLALLVMAAALPAATLLSGGQSGAAREDGDVLALERAALDRWGRGDPQGVLDLYAEDITYYDPFQARRVDGLAAMKALYAPLVGKMKVKGYEITGAKVQRSGDVAILTYHLRDEVEAQPADLTLQWNVTTVYARRSGAWKILHSHFSFVKAGVPAKAN